MKTNKRAKLYVLFAIFTMAVSSLNAQVTIQKQPQNGSYSFQKASVSVSNRNTGQEVFSRNFNDTLSLSTLRELDLPPVPVFLSADIQNGKLTGGQLYNSDEYYNVADNSQPQKEESVTNNPYFFSPLNTLVINGKTATYTYYLTYGSSAYDFTLEAKFVITLIRDEPTR